MAGAQRGGGPCSVLRHRKNTHTVRAVIRSRGADPTIYKVIKREMDSAKGVISQVIVAGKASGLGRAGEQTPHNSQLQYVANVGLKVNHKLGGANMRIRGLGDSVQAAPPIWSTKPTMLLGIDVSHPQSFDSSEPSIAGIVASMDKYAPRRVCTALCSIMRTIRLGRAPPPPPGRAQREYGWRAPMRCVGRP